MRGQAVLLIREVWEAYWPALDGAWLRLVLIACLGIVIVGAARALILRWDPGGWFSKLALPGPLIVVLAIGLMRVFSEAACFDDAYISLRYADNLANGHGLVFNVGERVEGYTNFLWTLLLAGAIWLTDFDGPLLAMALCAVAYVANVLVVARVGARLAPHGKTYIPIAACCVALHPLIISYGTSGLETQAASLLVNVGLLFWLTAERQKALFLSGLCFVLAALTRPDHGIFFAIGGLVLLLEGVMQLVGPQPMGPQLLNQKRSRIWEIASSTLRRLLTYSAPFALYVFYSAWKYSYYGSLVPNTYYAKSAHLTYWSQGWIYIAEYALSSHLWLALPFVAGLLLVRLSLSDERLARFTGLSVIVYGTYVAKVGGDFMHGRFFLTLVPLLFLSLERVLWLCTLTPQNKQRTGFVVASLAAATLALSTHPVDLIGQRKVRWGIAHETDFYRIASWDPYRIDHFNFRVGKVLEGLQAAGFETRVAMKTVGMPAYYGKGYLLDRRGLADAHVARMQLKKRGRPGHEKLADPAYVQSRNVHFVDEDSGPEWLPGAARLHFGGVPRTFSIQRYDAELLRELRRIDPHAHFKPAPQAIDEYIRTLRIRTPARVAKHLAWLRTYYFDQNQDPKRLATLERYAAGERSVAPGHADPGSTASEHKSAKNVTFTESELTDTDTPTEASILFAGDAILARSVNTLVSRHGLNRPLGKLNDLISSADLSVVNLECVLASEGQHSSLEQYSKAYLRGRPELVEILSRAGFDVASLANNHGGDYGPEAIDETRRVLRRAGIDPLGAGKNKSESARPVLRKVGDHTVAFVGLQTTTRASQATEKGAGTHYVSLDDMDAAVEHLAQKVEEARAQADLVFLMIHWGPNNRERPDVTHREFARRAVREAGIDALLGTSAHMLQGVEVIDGRPILYDAGNVLLDWSPVRPWTHKSALFRLLLGKHGVTRVEMVPILLHHGRTVPAPENTRTEILERIGILSRELGTEIHAEGETGLVSLEREPPPRPLRAFIPDGRMGKERLSSSKQPPKGAIVKKLPRSAQELRVDFSGGISLLGFELAERTKAGLGINIATYFQTSVPQEEVHEIFFEVVPLEGDNNAVWTGEQHEPADWMYPTARWKPGQIVRDFYHIRSRGKLGDKAKEVARPERYDVYLGLQTDKKRLSPHGSDRKMRNGAVYLGTILLK